MSKPITTIITQYLPKTQHQPHLLLKSNRSLVQLYTNYPCVTGLSAELCRTHFNQNPWNITAAVQNNFLNFTLPEDWMHTQVQALAQNFHPAPETHPDADKSGYLHYVISVIAAEYPVKGVSVPYTKQESELCLWTLYLAEQFSEHRQKRKAEFLTRLSVLLDTYTWSKLSAKQQQLLLAAATVLNPQI